MSRKDRTPESQKDRNTAGEISSKATDPTIFDTQGGGGQSSDPEERGAEPGQYTDRGSPGYQGR